MTVAFAAQFVAEDIGDDSGLVFTAGMLHDLGKVVLAEAFKGDYARLVAETRKTGTPVVEREKASYGLDHAEVGARLLERWQFSAPLVASVRFHHDPPPAAAANAERFAACVNLADALAHSSAQDQAISSLGPDAALKILGLAQEDLSRYRERIKENLEFVEAMCRLRG